MVSGFRIEVYRMLGCSHVSPQRCGFNSVSGAGKAQGLGDV